MSDNTPEPETSVLMSDDLKAVRQELELLNSHRFIRMHNSFLKLIGFNLMRGLAFGLGTVLGASVLLSLLAWSVSQIEFLPIIGEWATEILRQIEEAR
ncbi:MAG: DUF5665 domain-containing protein [Roseovarius sp.]